MSSAHPPRPKLNLSVGITGHRPPLLDDQAEAMVRPLLTEVLKDLAEAAAELQAALDDVNAIQQLVRLDTEEVV